METSVTFQSFLLKVVPHLADVFPSPPPPAPSSWSLSLAHSPCLFVLSVKYTREAKNMSF